MTRRRLLGTLTTAALAAALAACGPATPTAPSPQVEPIPTGAKSATEASLHLGWAALSGSSGANVAVSPSSFAITLMLLAEGASGATLEQLNNIFGSESAERLPEFSQLRHGLNSYDALPTSVDANDPPPSPIVHQATQVSLQEGHTLGEQFLNAASPEFGAVIREVTLEEWKPLLDEWVATHTAGLIEKSAIDPTPATVVVIQDAILFAAAWQTEFLSNKHPLTFHAPGGEQEIVALWGKFDVQHALTDRFEAVRLPYDQRLAMDVVMPAEGVELTADDMADAHELLTAAAPKPVAVTMPPLNLTTKVDLLSTMSGLGVDFSGGLNGIYPGAEVSAFVQQVRLEVTAKGTVGAAVTEAAMATGLPAQEPIQFTVDRPFVLSVLDTSPGWPLFLAKVSDAQAAAG